MSAKPKEQLNLLLLKAESYSQFLLENQKRTHALIQTQENLKNEKESAEKKRKSSTPGSSSKKAKVETDPAVVKDSFVQPPNITGGTLMPYQLEGLQWLLSLWENGLNGILADEMGLGKTIQIISLIAHLRHYKTYGPFLIVGPLATLPNWLNEFKKWVPSCPVVLYHGSKEERDALRRKHLPISQQKTEGFPIVITSFEMCIADRQHLEKYVWQYLILDEGHRIKNRKCKLIRELKSIKSISRLLLTGTPIQNSLEELWSLLNFCSPVIFDDLEVFQSWFGFKNIGKDTQVESIIDEQERDQIVTKLHEILRPFLLRRIKKDVLPDKIAPKVEIVIYCNMTALQSEYYSHVLDGTIRDALIEMNVERAKNVSQINMNMNLRKVCNHPFLFGEMLDRKTGKAIRDSKPEILVTGSGKFKLLDRMLPQLIQEGHKVLIFSQMTELLNLLEDYLYFKSFNFVRLDGSTKLDERQEAIDKFNENRANSKKAEQNKVPVFLLSTRAGGLGINLTAADTVIIFDSDWNPHQDSQAQDRCHRIGQDQPVVIYRFLTSSSVEIDMMRKQLSKKKLERLTIVGGDFRAAGKRLNKRGLTADELRKLLEDDVDFSRVDGSSSQSKGSAKKKKTLTDIEDIEKVISDEELRLIMDRKLLFQNSTWNKNLLKLQAVQTPNSKDSIAKRGSRTSLTTCDSNSSVPADSEDDDIIDEKDVLLSPDGDNQCAALVEQVQDMDDLFSIPTEGAMYDVIDTGRATFMAIN